MSDDEIQQLFNMIDKDKSGTLSLRVFMELLDFNAEKKRFKVQQSLSMISKENIKPSLKFVII